ncbi:uncharacterized protein LOC100214647 isoform X2 [Hydra vulgaris]|uniref:Uncharacterized protein LOC100214647 isoform X2 n=1 Tax=Hydra vulgaris TaxID=6087 RepID=A0ABM4B424_HYDVU
MQRTCILLFLVVFTINCVVRTEAQTEDVCDVPIDLVFALDASQSIKKDGFSKIKEFSKTIINNFKIDEFHTHVGALVFSEIAEVQFRLDELFEKQDIFDRIDKIPYPGYRTATDDALRVANKYMFSLSGGARQGVPQVLILVNDGRCTVCSENVSSASAPLKERGVSIFCVGISKTVDKKELLSIASEPAEDHFFYVETIDELPTFISKLHKKTCEVKKGKCPISLPPFNCKPRDEDNCFGDNDCPGKDKCCFNGCIKQCKPPLLNCLTPVDVALAFDSSSSVGELAYEEMKKFAHQVVDSFSISQQNARFAALVYGSNASVEFNFVRYDSALEIKQAIQSLSYLKSNTRIDKALEVAKSDLFSLQGKVRSRRPMILYVFFDGTVTRSMSDLESVVQPLKDYGVKIIAIGVGPEVNRYQLKKISEDNAIFSGKSFKELAPLLYSIVEQSCSEKSGKCSAVESVDKELCAGVIDECSNDFDCFGEAKCCKKGCKKSCIPKAGVCPRKVDVAFVLHLNMDADDFDIAQFFLKSAIDRFKISTNGAHAALLTFGQETDIIFDFKSGQTSNDDLKSLIGNIKFIRGKGNLEDVLAKMCDAVFCVAGGTRDAVPKLLYLIVGETASGDPIELENRIQTLRSRGVDVIVLAVGDNLNLPLLQSLTSTEPFSESRVWLSREYIDTMQYLQDIADFACSEAGELPPVGPLVEKTCGGSTPNVCYRGPKGSRGRPGPVGQRGEPGVEGSTGPKGIDGPKGIKGEDGVLGPKGNRGETGLPGLPGFPGYDGIPGVPGIEGRMGEYGDCGLPGTPGEVGPPGLDGFNGSPGRQGPAGEKGKKGPDAPFDPNLKIFPGDKGSQGEAGPVGFKGMRGIDGPKGDMGDNGVDGAQGLKGEEGEIGETGNFINVKGQKGYRGSPGPPGPLFEAGTSTDGEGMAGDVGPDGSIGEKGLPGERGESSEETGRKGQPGPQGDQGEAGPSGPAGPKGAKGLKGETGRPGNSGEKGEKGKDGQQGLKGEKGNAGELGDKGKTGPQGFDGKVVPGAKGQPGENSNEIGNPGQSGSAGNQGPPGKKGQVGQIGQQGIVGDRGSVGPRGPKGSSGAAGSQGPPGDVGPNGPKGYQGAKGDEGRNGDLIPGKNGIIGSPGEKGVQGPQGVLGPKGPKGDVSTLICSEGKCPKGEKGVRGPRGNVGDIGPPGVNGTKGPKGFQGDQCPVCPPGDQGPPGETGSFGSPGKVGDKGDLGEVGPVGQRGKKGPPGAVGMAGLKGKKGVLGSIGPIGDKGDTGPGTSLAPKGERGLNGADGKQGDRGPPGDNGDKGFKGQSGAPGKRGIDGKKGAIGLTGETGLDGGRGIPGSPGDPGDGEMGLAGEVGSDGRIGDQGPIGDSGPDGPVGEPGAGPTEEELKELSKSTVGEKGIKGEKGDQGAIGPKGVTGIKGQRGSKGIHGDDGPKGFGGITGEKGESGKNGTDGKPGSSGLPGKQGRKGEPGEIGLRGPDGVTERGEKGKEGEPGMPGKDGEDAPPPPGCFTFGDPTDIAFILDSSRSVTRDHFNRQKEFVKTILGEFPLGEELTQAGIIKYGRTADIEINFGEFLTQTDLFNAIDKIKHSQADESRLDLALKKAHEELFTSQGARSDKDIEKAIVILGDGYISGGGNRSRDLIESAKKEAAKLRELGVLIFTIGVGAEPNSLLLQNFASKKTYYITVKDYGQLIGKIGALKTSISSACNVVTPGEPGRDGRPGEKGLVGEKGRKGNDGISPKGLQGPKGVKGEKGSLGVGIKGLPGDEGPIGPIGEYGIPGKDGLSVDGAPGLKGARGESGDSIKGIKGLRGKVGDVGLPGVDSKQILCDKVLQTDMLFLLDSSGSVGDENFDKMKEFVKSIVLKFDVDNQLTRVGIIKFDSDAEITIQLSDHKSLKDLLNDIDSIRYTEGIQTRIDKALERAMEAFSEKNGGRADATKALVLLADGQNSFIEGSQDLDEELKPLIDAKVLRYVIGIGRELDLKELEDIATNNIAIYADSFDELKFKVDEQISRIAERGCQGPPGPPGINGAPGRDGKPGADGPAGSSPQGEQGSPGRKGTKGIQGDAVGDGTEGEKGDIGDEGPIGFPGCTNEIGEINDIPTDIAFALDASASFYEEGFQQEKDFVKSVIDKIELSSSGVRVGVLTYSDEAKIRIRFDYSFDKEDVKKAIDNIPYDSMGTRIDLGLEAAKELFLEKSGGRGSSKKVLILLTDGQQTYIPDAKDPVDYAKELAEYGVDIFAIGIGDEINKVDLEDLISKPQHIFLSDDINSLITDLSKDISTALSCEGGPRGPPGQPGDDGPPGSIGPAGEVGRGGLKGDRGDPGLGPKGDKGEPGLTNKVGEKGDRGYRGHDGPNGAPGLHGAKGLPGPKGAQGDSGFQGIDGNKGQKGSMGAKGPKGSSTEQVGAKGVPGDKGDKGPVGEPGKLPPGSKFEDLDGPKGPLGPKGEVGGPGRPGKFLIAPGQIGLAGLKGDKGESGKFGDIGYEGDAGTKGTKGEQGDMGKIGRLGDDGPVGNMGAIGDVGDEGDQGISLKGEQGEQGMPGERGSQGPKGEDGLPGFFGMPGPRGDKGEQGPRGKQQTLDQTIQFKASKGIRGEKGYTGDFGLQGETGEPGVAVGAQGQRGDKGLEGPKGETGEQGVQGDEGLKGLPGKPGPNGQIGDTGERGDQGPKGPVGDVGERIGGSEKGELGSIGLMGLGGRKGTKAERGDKGIKGKVGSQGLKGVRGSPGFTGLPGEPGPSGQRGQTGPSGDKGETGDEGKPGPAGSSGVAEGFYIVRHSLSSIVPSCPRNYKILWSGYSLVYTVGNGQAHAQDLGTAGSCVKSFSKLPFLFCGISGKCKYASRNDFVYWLSGSENEPKTFVKSSAVEPYISRCVVCETPSIHIAVHSQDRYRPDCPANWEALWEGYSFLMVAAAGNTGAGQSLSSAGSCLETFRPKTIVECQGSGGTCNFFSDKFSFWLTTIAPDKQFQTEELEIFGDDDELHKRVSTCQVCIRKLKGSTGNIIEPPNG